MLPIRGSYDKWFAQGLQFGPMFRNLTNLNANCGYGHCEITVPDTAATMPESFEYLLPTHPVTLGAAFQMLTNADPASDRAGVMLPNAIGSLYISAAVPRSPGSLLKGYATRTPRSPTQHTGTIVLSDKSWGELIIVLKDLIINSIPSTRASSAKGHYSRLEWVLDNTRSRFPQT